MPLVDCFNNITKEWRSAFPKSPSHQRASSLSVASLCTLGRACISRLICFLGIDQQDWSAHYKLFSRTQWHTRDLFRPILKQALAYTDQSVVAVAFDDTKLKKTGKKIKTAFYQRDPLSPPFHLNLVFGLRFLQGSLLVPMYQKNDQPPRALPIMFKEAPRVKKPGKKASEAERLLYKQQIKEHNLSTYFVESLQETREELNNIGGQGRLLIAVVDGSFCNKTCMRAEVENAYLVARARKDAKLCFRSTLNGRKVYGDEKFTPESVRLNDHIHWRESSIYHGGKWRKVRFKEVAGVLWQRGTKDSRLRLIVIAPTPYRLTKKGKVYYREPAYLLCHENELQSELLIQKYFDRWQIEVNHREEKDTLGLGQAQVRSAKSVERQPSFVVASYSALLLAGILCFADKRGSDFVALPKWRHGAKRPSCLDLVQILRRELMSKAAHAPPGSCIDIASSVIKSAA